MAIAALLVSVIALALSLAAIFVQPAQSNRVEAKPADEQKLKGHVPCVGCSRDVPVYHGEPEGPRECRFCKARHK